jgi:hypothetical protein
MPYKFKPRTANKQKPKTRFQTTTRRGASTLRDIRPKAIERLQALWRLEADDDETWEPETEPIVTPMLKSVDGGIEHCVQALRAHDDEDAVAFVEMWDQCTKTDRTTLTVEEIAHAAGVGSLRLAEVVQTALFLYGNMQTQMMLAAGLPAVVATSLKQAKTKKGYADREWMLKAGKILPIPKGAQTAIQINTGEAQDQRQLPEGNHEWKYPEDRTKQIMAVINPKQLEAGTLNEAHPKHFSQNAPIVFER